MSPSPYKVLITTSGTGSRLGELTKDTNKALVDIAGRPALSYVLDKYPDNVPIVITVGYLAQQVRNCVDTEYSDRPIEFVTVSPFEGPGSSLGYSMLQAEPKLQCPFVFHACDTIVTDDIPEPTRNWAAGYAASAEEAFDASQYRTHLLDGERLARVNDKGAADFQAIHIGITGVHDFKDFWRTLRDLYEQDPNNSGLSDVHVIGQMLLQGSVFYGVGFSGWLDTGTITALKRARQYAQENKI